MGHDPHSSKMFVLFFVLFVLCCSVYCFCVNYFCHRVATQLQLTNISYHIISYFKTETPVIYRLQLGPISISAAVKLLSIVSLQYWINIKWNAEMKTISNKATHLKEAWPKRRVGYNWLQTYIKIPTSPKKSPVVSIQIYVTRNFLSITTLHFSYAAELFHFLRLVDTVKIYNSLTGPDQTQRSLGIINLHP